MKSKAMKTYTVNVREVHVNSYTVKAESEDEAKDLVADGQGDMMDDMLEFSHSLDTDCWTVDVNTKT